MYLDRNKPEVLVGLCEHMRLGMSSCGCSKEVQEQLVGVEFTASLRYTELVVLPELCDSFLYNLSSCKVDDSSC